MIRKAKSDSLSKKAYKFIIYPSEEQKIFFAKTFGCTRFIYNQMLADKISYYEKTKGMLLHWERRSVPLLVVLLEPCLCLDWDQ